MSDITYLNTHKGFAFLAVVIDLLSRKVVSWNISRHMRDELITRTVGDAVAQLGRVTPILFHSDQGSQYSSRRIRCYLEAHCIMVTMSFRGTCYDNAVAESFFSNLKKELRRRVCYPSYEAAEKAVFHYIKLLYNSVRRHTANQRLAPYVFEARYFKQIESV